MIGLGRCSLETPYLRKSKSLEQAKYIFDQCQKNQIGIVSYQDAKYPELARDILDMPLILYYKGNLKENLQGQAIVGARRCSRAGRTHAINCAISLANQHIPVISGMAKGIDSYAHTACLHYGGFTVAVLGCGLDICYPKEHELLKQRIEECGLILSEYEPGILPITYNFPKRNRIIAAISSKIIIPKAGKGSGAMITAEYGRKYGREVQQL